MCVHKMSGASAHCLLLSISNILIGCHLHKVHNIVRRNTNIVQSVGSKDQTITNYNLNSLDWQLDHLGIAIVGLTLFDHVLLLETKLDEQILDSEIQLKHSM
jgi:hypothetical protein